MNWTLLGIEPTKDKKAITRAYRQNLSKVNPEDKPEEFKALRAAYEEALALADQDEQPREEKTPVDLWADRLAALYGDLSRRIDPEAWQELLNDELCTALDTKPLIEEALLRFLMESYSLPKKIWELLESRFNWSERTGELDELGVPKDFVDYVLLEGPVYEEPLPYDLFLPGRDGETCDRYIRIYRELNRGAEEEKIPSLMEELESLPEQHPYGQAWILLRHCRDGKTEALEELETLAARYPENRHLGMAVINGYYALERYEETVRRCRVLLEADPDYRDALWVCCTAEAAMKNYKAAVDLICDMMGTSEGNPKELHQLSEIRKGWNEELIREYEARLPGEPENEDLIFDLSWALIQNEREGEAREVASRLPEGRPDLFGYHNLLSVLAVDAGDWEEACRHVDELIRFIPTMEDDGTEKTRKRRKRLPEMVGRKVSLLVEMGKNEEALAMADRAIELAPEDMELISRMAVISYQLGQYPKTMELADRMLSLRPSYYHAYYLQALALFRLKRDGDAYQMINRVIEQDGSELGEYILKTRLLIRNGILEEAEEILQMLRENGFSENEDVLFCEAQMARRKAQTKEERENALALFHALSDRLSQSEKDQDFDWEGELYYDKAVLMTSFEEKSWEDILETAEKALLKEPDDLDFLLLKGWILSRMDREEMAYGVYSSLESRLPEHPSVLRSVADHYYHTGTLEDLKKARERYERMLRREDDPVIRFYAGMCCHRLGLLSEAEEHFRKEQELDPEDVDGFYRLALTYGVMGRYEEACEQARLAVAVTKEWKPASRRTFYNTWILFLRRLGRYEEAVAACREIMEQDPEAEYYSRIVEIRCQEGKDKEIQKAFKEWAKTLRKNWKHPQWGPYVDKHILHLLSREKFGDVSMELLRNGTYLSDADRAQHERNLAVARGNLKGGVKECRKEMKAEGADVGRAMLHLALNVYGLGQTEEARETARQTMEDIDRKLDGNYDSCRTLYLARKVVLLAILGREQEARALCAEVKAGPLCDTCPYGSCKDMDTWEMVMEAVLGNTEKAYALNREYAEKWPDEEQIPVLRKYIKKLERKG